MIGDPELREQLGRAAWRAWFDDGKVESWDEAYGTSREAACRAADAVYAFFATTEGWDGDGPRIELSGPKAGLIVAVRLQDQNDTGRTYAAEAHVSGRSIAVRLEGYGDAVGEDLPVLVEVLDGDPQVVVWADVHKDESTHTISLRGAKIVDPRQALNGILDCLGPEADLEGAARLALDLAAYLRGGGPVPEEFKPSRDQSAREVADQLAYTAAVLGRLVRYAPARDRPGED